MMKQADKRNLTMVMDLYELTMANGYFNDGDMESRVAFDVFYRKNPDRGGFAIFAGLEQIVEYIENLHFSEEDIAYLRSLNTFTDAFLDYLKDFQFHGDIYSFPEGNPHSGQSPVSRGDKNSTHCKSGGRKGRIGFRSKACAQYGCGSLWGKSFLHRRSGRHGDCARGTNVWHTGQRNDGA